MKTPSNKKRRSAQSRKTVEALERDRALELMNMTNEKAVRKHELLQRAGRFRTKSLDEIKKKSLYYWVMRANK